MDSEQEKIQRIKLLEAALPGSLHASLVAAMAAQARGEDEQSVLKAAADAAQNAYEYWFINGEWPPDELFLGEAKP